MYDITPVSYEEAVAMLPDTETIHTMQDLGLAIWGVDRPRGWILDLLRKSRALTAGPGMGSLGHCLAVMQDNGTPIFVETKCE